MENVTSHVGYKIHCDILPHGKCHITFWLHNSFTRIIVTFSPMENVTSHFGYIILSQESL